MTEPKAFCGLRIEIAHRDAELGARLQDAHTCRLQRQVLAVGALNQLVEDGVVEDRPPRLINVATTDGRPPVSSHWSATVAGGGLIVGSDLDAAGQQQRHSDAGRPVPP